MNINNLRASAFSGRFWLFAAVIGRSRPPVANNAIPVQIFSRAFNVAT
jgi:hypothetical protein